MGSISLSIPQNGQPNLTEDPKVASDLTVIQTVVNGNLDASNISATLAQSAGVNQGGLTTKGAVSIGASQSTSSTSYTTLSTPDQVAGVTLPTNGLIAVWYQAAWSESAPNVARAALFVGSNQVATAQPGQNAPQTGAAE